MPPTHKPWTSYRIKAGNKQKLQELTHVAYIEPDLRIIKDGVIRTGMVTEPKVLTEDRIMACWFAQLLVLCAIDRYPLSFPPKHY